MTQGLDTPDLVVKYPQRLSTDTPILAGIPMSYPHDAHHTTISRSSYPHDLHHKTQCPFCPTYWSVNVSGRCYTSSIKIEKEVNLLKKGIQMNSLINKVCKAYT